jgi:hypothetical protein
MSAREMTPGRGVVPFVTPWSTEEVLPATVIGSPSGIRYTDETLSDRDQHGVLWRRMPSRPGQGRPLFGQMHSLRQRKAMRQLLCSVCGGPAHRINDGVLWLLRDWRGDWPGWPNGMAATEPPVCLPCARLSIRACPALRNRYAAVRVGTPELGGVYGIRYHVGQTFPTKACDETLAYEDPAIRWMVAVQQVRELSDCTPVDLDTL